MLIAYPEIFLQSENLNSYRNTREIVYRRINYKSAAKRSCRNRSIHDPAGLWLSSKTIAAYRFAVRFEFSWVIWRAWGMRRLPSDRGASVQVPQVLQQRSRLRQPGRLSAEICICALERWHTYSSYLEGGRSSDARIPNWRCRMPIFIDGSLIGERYLCITLTDSLVSITHWKWRELFHCKIF